jgi:nucleoside-diphosphate-sugar epimerase
MTETRLIVGCGYLGTPLAAAWSRAGHRVLATTRGGAGRCEALQGIRAEPVLFDVTRGGTLPRADVVVTAVGMDRGQGHSMREVYVDGLARVMAALPEAPRIWMHVSSTSVYGQDDGSWVDEDSPARSADGSGRVVLEAENLLVSGVRGAMVLRFGGIYGPNRLLKAKAIRQGDTFEGDPMRWLNLIHRDDGVRILDHLAEKESVSVNSIPNGVLNVVDLCPVQRGEFYAEMARLMGVDVPRWRPRPPDSPPGPHEGNNRRVSSARLVGLLGQGVFQFPTFREGLVASGPWE